MGAGAATPQGRRARQSGVQQPELVRQDGQGLEELLLLLLLIRCRRGHQEKKEEEQDHLRTLCEVLALNSTTKIMTFKVAPTTIQLGTYGALLARFLSIIEIFRPKSCIESV